MTEGYLVARRAEVYAHGPGGEHAVGIGQLVVAAVAVDVGAQLRGDHGAGGWCRGRRAGGALPVEGPAAEDGSAEGAGRQGQGHT